MAAAANLAAFQTSVEEDEGSLGAKGNDSTHICGRREGDAAAVVVVVVGERGWSEPPTRRAGIAEGAPDTLLSSLFLLQPDAIFREMEKDDLNSLHLLLAFLE
ncbi:Hypothetical predicted protein [Xyrichtys novacula]|uniref:Uncharacterized protein n=1 Tax=Xyrichtys novacula TaxID=13765 RepID=A0AAV1HNT7_XYRNO|nr:Hypothetical predicted protein [Xyrichtys novacula]